jgi:8-oxo-dGTP pyrophosphatase MutT (NUDIX family)
MRLDFPLPDDDGRHEYCIYCHAETVERKSEYFHCHTCGRRGGRRIVIDPATSWWVDDGEYWHESAGVFVRDHDGRFLFVERAIYPVGQLNVPAGHVDADESPEQAALRELCEEIGWVAPRVEHVATEDIVGDSCRRGADAHRWHAYSAVFDTSHDLRLSGEGVRAEWLTLAEARTRNLTHPVRHIIERYQGSAPLHGDAEP